MAVANTKSNIVTNADTPSVDSPGNLAPLIAADCKVREQVATVETAAADDAGSVYRLFRVHTSWRISQLLIGHDAVTNMSTADVGLYDIAEAGGAVIDVDYFASAIDISSASTGLVDRTYEATATDISKIEQTLYARYGFTGEHKWVDIAVTATTNDPSAAATISGLIRYVKPER